MPINSHNFHSIIPTAAMHNINIHMYYIHITSIFTLSLRADSILASVKKTATSTMRHPPLITALLWECKYKMRFVLSVILYLTRRFNVAYAQHFSAMALWVHVSVHTQTVCVVCFRHTSFTTALLTQRLSVCAYGLYG